MARQLRVSLDTFGRGDAGIHVRYASNATKAVSRSETSLCANRVITRRTKKVDHLAGLGRGTNMLGPLAHTNRTPSGD